MIITIDGPSGTGKSTVAKGLAKKLGFVYFDTGAMFRTLAYGIIFYKIDANNLEALSTFLDQATVTIKKESDSAAIHYWLNQHDVTAELRRHDVTDLASKISTLKAVRDKLAALQRQLAQGIDAVFEGRDMGSVIFPHAELKVFLTADPKIRAERRHKELLSKDASITLDKVLQDINERDERDSNRSIAPLKPAADATIIDTSHLFINDVIEKIASLL